MTVALVNAFQGLRSDGRPNGVRPKLTWELVIQVDVDACRIEGTLEQDRGAWKAAIRGPNPSTGGTRV